MIHFTPLYVTYLSRRIHRVFSLHTYNRSYLTNVLQLQTSSAVSPGRFRYTRSQARSGTRDIRNKQQDHVIKGSGARVLVGPLLSREKGKKVSTSKSHLAKVKVKADCGPALSRSVHCSRRLKVKCRQR